jgi:hypothetical protein
MKIRLIAALFVLFAVGVYVASVWVPPYGGGTEQLLQRADYKKALLPVGPGFTPPPSGDTELYGMFLDSDARALENARIYAKPLGEFTGDLALRKMAYVREHGRYRLVLPSGEWELWFEGGFSRRSSGETRLGRVTLGSSAHQRHDLQLSGRAAVIVELQFDDHPGMLLECELVDAKGEIVARGNAVSGATALSQAVSAVRGKFTSGLRISPVAGTGLIFEGLGAGKYTLRAYLSRENELVHELPLELSAGEVLQLGRITLDLGDFDESLRGQRLQVVE